jgi:hypothetical protein
MGEIKRKPREQRLDQRGLMGSKRPSLATAEQGTRWMPIFG